MSVRSAAMPSVAFRVAFLGRRGFALSRGIHKKERARWVNIACMYLRICKMYTSNQKGTKKIESVTISNVIRSK